MKTRKIWVGIGTCIVVGSAFAATSSIVAEPLAGAHSQHSTHGAGSHSILPGLAAGHLVLAQHQGGEGGEGGAVDLPPDLALAVRIALIRGHLLVGDELVRQKQWSAAMPHFLHPIEEIYPALSTQLDAYKLAPFDRSLKALSDSVKAKKGGADYTRLRAAVNAALATADAVLRDKQSANWAGFEIEAAVEILKVAGSEYGAAIEKGRVAKPVEYQDALGFVTHAAQMIEDVAGDLEKKDPAALAEVRAALARLKRAFPKAMPPKTPAMSHADLLSEVARVELASSRLM